MSPEPTARTACRRRAARPSAACSAACSATTASSATSSRSSAPRTSTPTPIRKSTRPSSTLYDKRPARRSGHAGRVAQASRSRSRTSAATPTSPSCGTPPRPPPTPSTTPASSATRRMVRNLIHASTEILRDAYDQAQPADELLEAAERKILEIAQMGITGQTHHAGRGARRGLRPHRQRARRRGHEPISGLPTGFIDLDEITAGLAELAN